MSKFAALVPADAPEAKIRKMKGPVLDNHLRDTPDSGEPQKWFENPILLNSSSAAAAATAAPSAKGKRSASSAASSGLPDGPLTMDALKTEAVACLDELIEADGSLATRRASVQWIEQMLSSGTIADKVSALTLQAKHSSIRSLRSLDSLLAIARKKGRREATLALDAMKDLFVSNLLPTTRKLRAFFSQPWAATFSFVSQNPATAAKQVPHDHPFRTAPSRALLGMWALEDGLKTRYAAFLDIVEDGLSDPLEHLKRQRLNTVYDLLSERPEAEDRLLSMLVNKLGDSARKVAAKVQFLLFQLLERNPGMKIAVVKEVERLLFRPHIAQRAQYFALCFTNQIVFDRGDAPLAQALIGIYFSLFKLLAAGLIRGGAEAEAIAAAGKKIKKEKKHPPKAGRNAKPTAPQSKMSSRIALSAGGIAVEAADPGLSKKLLSAILTGVNRAVPYARAVDDDEAVAAVDGVLEDHSDALFDVVSAQEATAGQGYFSVIVQALVLLHQISRLRPAIESRFFTAVYRAVANPELLTTSKTMLFMNLLFKTLRRDTNAPRVVALAKRLLQVSMQASASFACASLFLLYAVGKNQPALAAAMVRGDSLAPAKPHGPEAPESQGPNAPISAFFPASVETRLYDSAEGDPSHARASATGMWELNSLSSHYHPSVALFASHLLRGDPIVYTGNPLDDFSRASFLDRFVRKQPKGARNAAEAAAAGSGAAIDDDDEPLDEDDRKALASFEADSNSRAAQRAARRALVGPATLHRPAARVVLTAPTRGDIAAAQASAAAVVAAENAFRARFVEEKAKRDTEGLFSGKKHSRMSEDDFAAMVMEREMARMGGGAGKDDDDLLDDDLDDVDLNEPLSDFDYEGDDMEGDAMLAALEGDVGEDGSDGEEGFVSDDESNAFGGSSDEEVAAGHDDDDEEEEEESEESDAGPKSKRARTSFTAQGAFDDDDDSDDDDDGEEEEGSEVEADDSDADEEAAALREMMGDDDSDDDEEEESDVPVSKSKGGKTLKLSAAEAAAAVAAAKKLQAKGKKGSKRAAPADDDTDDELQRLQDEMDDESNDDSDDETFGGDTFAAAEEFADILERSGAGADAGDVRDMALAEHGFTGKTYGKVVRGKTVIDKGKGGATVGKQRAPARKAKRGGRR